MKVEWIISLVLATLACYAWWELRKVRAVKPHQAIFNEFEVDGSPMSQQEIMNYVAPIAKTIYAKQSEECPIAEAVLGATVASMVARSQPEHVARFLRQCADSMERLGDHPNLQALYERQRRQSDAR